MAMLWHQDSLQARALRNASIGYFDYRPDWAHDATGNTGKWCWFGARFGIADIDGPDGRACLISAVNAADQPGLQRLLGVTRHEAARSTEFRVPLPTGHILFLYCEAYAVADLSGRPAVVFGTVQDVTSQRKFETDLTEIVRRNHLLLATIDACPLSVTVAEMTQPDAPLIYANRRFLELTGYEADEVIGRNCRFLQGPATDQRVVRQIHDTIKAGGSGEFSFINYRRDGSQFQNRIMLAPIFDEAGERTAYIGLQADATHDARRHEAEAQRQKMEALGRMMGGVAHEINNMLQPVLLLGQDLIEKQLVAKAGEQHLDILLDCSRKARHIISDLLAFSRPGQRTLEVHDPVALLEDSLRLVRPPIPPSVSVSICTSGTPPPVAMDRTMFVQILLNLVTNAVSAMGGEGELTIALDEDVPSASAAPFHAATRFARLRVSDTGCGMDRLTLDRAFEPFFTTKPIGQGTGLGLPMVYGLIRELGGTIALDSEPGRGTTATMMIPGFHGGK